MANEILSISSLTDFEFVSLVAHYTDLTDGEKSKISPALLNRGYSAEMLAQASSKFAEKFSPVVSCGLRFTEPFSHLKFEPINYILTLFENFERGSLPYPGSVSEQPAQIMEIFSVLRQLKHEAEIKAREKSNNNVRNQRQNNSRTRR